MAQPAVSPLAASRQPGFVETSGKNEAAVSGVSWAAVIGGAFVAAAISLILLALGAGMGLSSVSPWSNVGASPSTVGKAAIVWLIITQIIASAMGGYLAGRLRTKWANIHTDEVYFRDTAHGFLVWAVGLVITAAFLTSAAISIVGGTQLSTSGPARASGDQAGQLDPNAYFEDMLFRSDDPATPNQSDVYERAEVGRIFANAIRQKGLPSADKNYLVELTAVKTGLNRTEADGRVSDVFAQAQQATETARKAIAHSLYWTFLALLIGAFCASFAATIGGQQRDHVVVI